MSLMLTESFFAANHLESGIAYLRQNMFHEAVYEFDRVIEIDPDDKYAHWNRATALLSLGDYANGFVEHDWGWKLFDWRGYGPVREDIDRLRPMPIWHGEDISDKRLLVYHELGLGDGIQCLRYLPELRRRAAHVTLIMSPELVRLAKRFDVEVVEAVPDDLTGYAYRLPFFGVMSALKQTLSSIPRESYLTASWRHGRKPMTMGIAWSGRTQNAFSADYFLSMLSHRGYKLFSLQLGVTAKGVKTLDATDFANTAEMIASVEHVVTVDTAAAHLAGALGHPSTHLLLPYFMDWRWHRTDAWYPTIKTYRQDAAGDWATPFARLNQAIANT